MQRVLIGALLAMIIHLPAYSQELMTVMHRDTLALFNTFGLNTADFSEEEIDILGTEMEQCLSVKNRDIRSFFHTVDRTGVSIDSSGANTLDVVTSIVFSDDFSLETAEIVDPRFRWINDDVAILYYSGASIGSYNGDTFNGATVNTSVYQRIGGAWRAIHHHSTDLDQ